MPGHRHRHIAGTEQFSYFVKRARRPLLYSSASCWRRAKSGNLNSLICNSLAYIQDTWRCYPGIRNFSTLLCLRVCSGAKTATKTPARFIPPAHCHAPHRPDKKPPTFQSKAFAAETQSVAVRGGVVLHFSSVDVRRCHSVLLPSLLLRNRGGALQSALCDSHGLS